MPTPTAGKAIVLNIMSCTGPAYTTPPVPAPYIAPAPNVLQQGCPYFLASVAPGQPTLYWDRYIFFTQRWQWTHDQRWDALWHLALFILAYRLVSMATWRIHYGRCKA